MRRFGVGVFLFLALVLSTAVCAEDMASNVKAGIEGLSDKDINTRIAMADALVKIGRPAVKSLLDARDKMDPDAQLRAEDVIVRIGAPAVDALIERLRYDYGGKDPDRGHIHAMLAGIGEPAVTPLINALSGESEHAAGAAQMLGDMHSKRAVPALITGLKSGDESLREAFADALGRIGDPRAVKPLIAALKSESILSPAHPWVIAALGKLKDPAAIPVLAPLLGDIGSSFNVEYALAAIGDPAIPTFNTALKSENPDARKEAIEGLKKLQTPKAINALIGALKSSYPDVRSGTASALGEIRNKKAVDPLIGALKDSQSSVRASAAGALASIGDERAIEPLAAMLNGKDNVYAALALSKWLDPRAVPSLVAAIAAGARLPLGFSVVSTSDKERLADRAEFALREYGADAAASLLAVVKDKSPATRFVAVKILATLAHKAKDNSASTALIEAMSDSNFFVRREAIDAFADLKDDRATDALIPLLKDNDPYIRASAAASLGYNFAPRALDPLRAAMEDEYSNVHGAAFAALVRHNALNVQELFDGTKEVHSTVQWDAFEALGNSIDPQAVDFLISAMQDMNPQFKPARKEPPSLMPAEVQATYSVLQQAILTEDEMAKARISRYRSIAVRELGRIKDQRAIAPLAAAMSDKDMFVAMDAARALGEIGSAEVVEPLVGALKKPDYIVRAEAAKALGKIKDSRAIPGLTVLLNDVSPTVRDAAAEALKSIKGSSG